MSTPVIPKLATHPILLPQTQFKDMFGKPNAYLEMNPAMHIQENGSVKILVRCVNYRKFQDKQFALYEPKSNSKYFLMSGNLNLRNPLNLDNFAVTKIQYSYGRPTYPSYWTGPEDIRFINDTQILATIPECNPSGNPCIFRAELNSSLLSNFQPCFPNSVPEKNWMPFQSEKVIYSLSPFLVKSVNSDDKFEILISEKIRDALQGYHGSTNGIQFQNGEFIFLIHGNRDKSYHRWLRFNPDTKQIAISPEFVFFRNSYIEFPCSLSEWNQTYFIGLGVNDDKAFIVEISKFAVQNQKWIS